MGSSAEIALRRPGRGGAPSHPLRRPVRIGIVAGETSGDMLGAGLIEALRRRLGEVRFEGICGPRMAALGCRALYAMEAISLLGFEDLLARSLAILRIRRSLVRRFLADPPDVFVGVDVPDFNLSLELRLRRRGIRTVHYVSPTVWAWRGYRIRKIGRAVDHMLTLFPFEAEYYRRHGVPVTFVGHPMADQIRAPADAAEQRRRLGLDPSAPLVALLPGSRMSELRRLGALFIRTAQWLQARNASLRFVAPFVDSEHRRYFEVELERCGARPPITRLDGRAREAMGAADVVLLASGTAALEAALLGRPMVVSYRLNWPSYWLTRALAQVELFSMPNNLAGREVVPELIQGDAVPEKLGRAVERFLHDASAAAEVRAAFDEMRRMLRGNASERAAEVVARAAEAA